MSMDELRKIIPDDKNALDYLIALYDSEISYLDYNIGKLFSELGLDEHSMIIITSDHGEEFLDHGSLSHGHTLYQELIHVPLIVKFPVSFKEPFMNINQEQVSIIDIMPTVLGLLEIMSPHENKGRNLFEVKKSSTEQTRDYIFSEVANRNIVHMILKNNWKYIYNAWTQKEELYNLARDNKESDNLIHKNNATAMELKKELFNFLSNTPQTTPIKKRVKPTAEIEEKLKAMGYIQGDE
jgi:arylsulfatase A-like enzyme